MSSATTRQRYANLDALRAIAALAVMVEHMFGDLLRQVPAATGPISIFAQSLVQNLSLGRFGVALFFLISGFVVPFSIGGKWPLRHFAISRLFRLYPALWLALAVLTTTAWLAGEAPGTATVLANLTMAPPLLRQPWLSPIHWTLFVELLFYVFVALLFFAGALRQVGILLGLSLALIAATVLPVQLRTHGVVNLPVQYLGLHLSFLFLGLLLRLWLVERMRGARLAALVLVLAQFAALFSVSQFSLARGDNFVMEGLRPVLSAYMLAFVVFLAAIRLDWPRSSLLAGIGLTSYSMYLFHGTVNAAVYRVLPLTGQLDDIATMLVCTGSTLLVSWLVYRAVERPMIALGRRTSSRRDASLIPSSRIAGEFHGRPGWNRLVAATEAGIQSSVLHPASDYRAARHGGRSLEMDPSPPPPDIAVEAAREMSVSDKLVGGILGTAIAAVTLSWFALLGYVGWKIAESL
ncbi:acyltransferase [Boseaceae bacterium BT-24-1]|nr:acyltransferase [Boseaceae bacterium BT-24-1]